MLPVSNFLAGARLPASKIAQALRRPVSATSALTNAVRNWLPPWEKRPAQATQQRANRAAAADMNWFQGLSSPGAGWARTEYGEYYATSVSVYAAVRLRAEALSRPPLVVNRRDPDGNLLPVGAGHPLQQLMDRVNPWYTRGDLWRATEIYLSLWGSAFWALEKDEAGGWEIWPLRPDRVTVMPDKNKYIRGFVYMGANGPVAYTSEEVVWLRYFNPMEEFAGLSPIAPIRMAVDMGKDALKFNRNFLRNSAQPDFVLLTNETMTDNEIEDFYTRWEARYRGPGNARRPAIASFVRDIKTLVLRTEKSPFSATKLVGTPSEISKQSPLTVTLVDMDSSTHRRSSGVAAFSLSAILSLIASKESRAAWDSSTVARAAWCLSNSSLRWVRLAFNKAPALAKASSDTSPFTFNSTSSVSDSVTFRSPRSVVSRAF